MGDTKPYLRIAAFAGVLIISSALVLGLFQEASAVTMKFVDPEETITGDEAYTLDIKIEEGKRIPIEDIEGVIEKKNPNFDSKFAALMIERSRCPMSPSDGMECTDTAGTLEVQDGDGGAINRITFIGAFAGEAGEGNEVASGPGATGYFGPGDRDGVLTTGYGYDDFSPAFDANNFGYGYGYGNNDLRQTADFGYGDGYGYNDDDLVLRFEVEVDCSELEQQTTHYLTVHAITGFSGPFVDEAGGTITPKGFSSPFHAFTPNCTGGGGGSPGGGGGPGGGGVICRVAAGEAIDFSDCERGVRVISGFPDFVRNIFLDVDLGCEDCRIEIEPVTCTDLSPAIPESWQAGNCFSIHIRDQDDNDRSDLARGGWLVFTSEQQPSQAVTLIHHVNPWVAEPTEPEGEGAYNATLSGLSNFAVALDVEDPSISDVSPTGEIGQVTPRIEASYTDNRGIDTDEVTLSVDGTEVTSDMGTLQVSETSISYVPGSVLEAGQRDVSLTVTDESGRTTTETWSFTVTPTPECPTPPRIVSVNPADGSTASIDTPITVTINKGPCDIVSSTIRVNGASVSAQLNQAQDQLTATLPDSVDVGDTVSVTATVTDTGGNVAEHDWSYTTEAEDGGPPGDGEPPADDGNALVWVIVILILLAAVGVGAYFYMEQQ